MSTNEDNKAIKDLVEEIKQYRTDQRTVDLLRSSIQELKGTVETMYRDINGNGRKGIFTLFEEHQEMEEERLSAIERSIQELRTHQQSAQEATEEYRARREMDISEARNDRGMETQGISKRAEKRQRVQIGIAVAVFLLLQVPSIVVAWKSLMTTVGG